MNIFCMRIVSCPVSGQNTSVMPLGTTVAIALVVAVTVAIAVDADSASVAVTALLVMSAL